MKKPARKKVAAKKRAAKTTRRKRMETRPRKVAPRDAAVRRKQLEAVKLNDDQARALRQVVTTFSRDVPQQASSAGVYEPGADKGEPPFIAGKVDVPDGRYRIIGNDWILTIKGRQVQLIERASPKSDPKTYVQVPG